MGPNLYMQEKLVEQHHREMLHEVEQNRMVAQRPRRRGAGRHVIARFGTFLVAVGMWLERVERREAEFSSKSGVARSLPGTLR